MYNRYDLLCAMLLVAAVLLGSLWSLWAGGGCIVLAAMAAYRSFDVVMKSFNPHW